MSTLSRRQFLRLMALTTGALAGGRALSACSQPAHTPATAIASQPTTQLAAPTSTMAPTSGAQPPTATLTPEPSTPTVGPTLPLPTPDPEAMVTIIYDGSSQFEIVSPQGNRVVLDVVTPGLLQEKQFRENDALLVTHTHPDHFNAAFAANFPGKKLVVEAGELALADMHVYGIAAGHNATDKFLPKEGSNYIFVVAVNGLRIAHFGDIGQEALTEEQLAALGSIDVAMMQLSNSYSEMNLDNKKGFNLMEQVKPKIILPTHADSEVITHAFEIWQGYCAEENSIQISPATLPEKTSIVMVNNFAFPFYRDACKSGLAW